MKDMCRTMMAVVVGASGLIMTLPAVAEYPQRGVGLIVAYGAGGGTDITARMLASDLEETLGQTVTVQNITGGGGWNGWGQLANSDPDGYTIGYINVPNMFAGYLGPDMSREETLESFTLLMNHVTDYCVWAVAPDSPFQTVNDVIDAMADSRVTINAHGFGGDDHLGIIRMERMNEVTFNVIHNTSTPESVTQVLGGHVMILAANVSEVAAQHESGELRVLGVMSPERSDFMPDVPTFREQGFDQVWSVSRGIAAPGDLPQDIADSLQDALQRTIGSDAHREAAERLFLAPEIVSGAEYEAFLHETEQEVKALMGW